MTGHKQFYLSRQKTLCFLKELEADDVAKSLFLPADLPTADIERLLEKYDPSGEIAGFAAKSKVGAAVFQGAVRTLLVTPPFPLIERRFIQGYDTGPLLSLLENDRRIAVVLVRLGTYAIGLCDGEEIIVSKVGTGLVHGRHKKGGSSQQRFRRHREKQIEYFLTRVCGHVEEKLEPYAASIDHIVYGGARTTINALRENCGLLNRYGWDELPPLMDTPNPNRAVLEKSIRHIWCSRVVEWERRGVPGHSFSV